MNTEVLSHAPGCRVSPQGRALRWQQMLTIQSYVAASPALWGEATLAVPLRGLSSVRHCIRGLYVSSLQE